MGSSLESRPEPEGNTHVKGARRYSPDPRHEEERINYILVTWRYCTVPQHTRKNFGSKYRKIHNWSQDISEDNDSRIHEIHF